MGKRFNEIHAYFHVEKNYLQGFTHRSYILQLRDDCSSIRMC